MAVIVRIPTPFQHLTEGFGEIEMVPDTIAGIVGQLEALYPGIGKKLSDGRKIRGFIHILVNDNDIRFLKNEGTEVRDGDEVAIIPAIAGG
jgi:sulfur-carrier protein